MFNSSCSYSIFGNVNTMKQKRKKLTGEEFALIEQLLREKIIEWTIKLSRLNQEIETIQKVLGRIRELKKISLDCVNEKRAIDDQKTNTEE